MRLLVLLLALLLMPFAMPFVLYAQEATPEAAPGIGLDITPEAINRADLAFFRVAHLDLGGADLNLYLDSAPVSMGQGDPRITPGSIYDYQPARPATYSLAFTAFNSTTMYIGPASITFDPGHRYTLALVGSLTDETLRLLFLDETRLLGEAAFNPAAQSAALYIDNLAGVPGIDVSDDGTVRIDNLAAGDYALSVVEASDAVTEYRLLSTEGDVLAAFPRAGDPAGAFTLVAVVGGWSGDASAYGSDYGLLTPSTYIGDLTVTQGGTIAPATPFSAAFTLAASGERRRFALTLPRQTTLTIALTAEQSGEPGTRPVDPYLRIYDADQARPLAENDEQPPTGTPLAANLSAAGGVLTLPAGDYFIDAASYLDLFGGAMVLEVSAE